MALVGRTAPLCDVGLLAGLIAALSSPRAVSYSHHLAPEEGPPWPSGPHQKCEQSNS